MNLSAIGMNCLLYFDKRFDNFENGKITVTAPSVCSPSSPKNQEQNVGRKIYEVALGKPFL
jgi:hypothetical protein